eukprot:scaffold61712_cov69-Phaeocystis_antarctica.AAC.13
MRRRQRGPRPTLMRAGSAAAASLRRRSRRCSAGHRALATPLRPQRPGAGPPTYWTGHRQSPLPCHPTPRATPPLSQPSERCGHVRGQYGRPRRAGALRPARGPRSRPSPERCEVPTRWRPSPGRVLVREGPPNRARAWHFAKLATGS